MKNQEKKTEKEKANTWREGDLVSLSEDLAIIL